MKKALLAVLAAALAVPATAAAHVTANPSKAPADSFAVIAFRVPHGCEDSPTTSLSIQIPEGVVSVAPQAVPGWTVETTTGKYATPVELHGETITEGVKTVTWSGGSLDAHQFSDFGMSIKLPPGEPGTKLLFPAVQKCAKGETRWIEEQAEGEPEPEAPAPVVELTAAEGASEPAAMGTDTGPTEGEEPAIAESDDDKVNLALGFGIAGLVAGLGGFALGIRGRRA